MEKPVDMNKQHPVNEDVSRGVSSLHQANESVKLGNLKDARRYYLEAAELLYKAAKLSGSPRKEILAKQGSNLLEQARSIGKDAISSKSPGRTVTGPSIPDDTEWIFINEPTHSLSDVSGLEPVKEQILMKMVYPFTHVEEATRLGMKKVGGILLFGPPGTGKTMLAKAVAGEVDAPFLSVNAASIMSKWVGEAEKKVERLFAEARNHARCVIFIDEVDSLLPKRSSSNSTVMKRVVPQFLSEMDGIASKSIGDHSLLLVAATNEPWNLDEAVMRPGRFDEKIFVGLPDYPARFELVDSLTRNLPGLADQDLSELVLLLEGYSGADIVQVIEKSKQIAFLDAVLNDKTRDVSLDDLHQSLSEVKPSVSKKSMDKYKHFLGDSDFPYQIPDQKNQT